MIVNPNCFVVNFLKFIRRKINTDGPDFDAVTSCSEDPVVIVGSRLELTTESGLVQGLDDLRPKYVYFHGPPPNIIIFYSSEMSALLVTSC